MQKYRVAIIHNTMAPYRHPFFEELSKNTDLNVYYCSGKYKLRKWASLPKKYSYKYKILPGIQITTPVGEFSINPTVVGEIVKDSPNVIILNGYTDPTIWFSFLLAKVLRIPQVYWTEGVKEPASILGKLTRPLRVFLSRNTSAVIVPGNLSKSCVVDLGSDINKIFVSPNAIDNELFEDWSSKYVNRKNELKTKFGIKTDRILILYIGRLIEEKGLLFLMDAFRKLKLKNDKIALLIVGYGDLFEKLKTISSELKLTEDVILTGIISDFEILIKCYCSADVFVLPTLADVWGFVINEAMVCGLPIISTNASQAAIEMIRQGENGFVINEANVDELTNSIEKLVSDSDLRVNMGAQSKKIVTEQFSIVKMVEGFLSSIDFVANK